MSHPALRPARIATAAALLIGAAGLAACGNSSSNATAAAPPKTTATTAQPTPAPASATVKATLTEFKIAMAPASVAAGHVVFDVSNAGKVKHQFTIIRTDKSAAKVLSKRNPDDDIPGARGEVSSIQPGASKKLVIKNLKAGHYAIVCALPGHYQSGMYADFTVK